MSGYGYSKRRDPDPRVVPAGTAPGASVGDGVLWEPNRAKKGLESGHIGDVSAGRVRSELLDFIVDLDAALATVTDRQATPQTRVRMGRLGNQLTDYGIEIYGPTGDLLFGADGALVEAPNISIDQLSELTEDAGIIVAGVFRDADSKFLINLDDALLEVLDEQTTPETRVRLGRLGIGEQDYGIEIYDAAGDLILGATGLGINTVGTSQLVDGSLTLTKFATNYTPIEKVTALPTLPDADYPEGMVVYLTTDEKLYRSTGAAWTKAADGADLLAASVTADKVSVTSLSALSANIGTATAGIVRSSDSNVVLNLNTQVLTFGAASAPGTGTGVFLGLASSVYQFRVGNPAGQYILWNGSALTYTGALSSATGSVSALDGTFGTVTAGLLRNPSNTRFIHLDAPDGDPWISCDRLDVRAGDANGLVRMFRVSSQPLFNMTATSFYLQEDASSPTRGINIMGTRPVGWTTYVDLTVSGANAIVKTPNVSLNADGSVALGNHVAIATNGNVTFSGSLSAVGGTFGTITAGMLATGSTEFDLTNQQLLFGANMISNQAPTGTGVYIGLHSGAYKLFAGNSAGQHLLWDGSSLTFAGALSSATGTVSALAGTFGTVTAAILSSGSTELHLANETLKMGSATSPSSGTGIFMGLASAAYQFRVGNPSGAYLLWNGTALTFTGALSGATGTFSGSLSAATGTFAGTLSAAGGTFGTITAGLLSAGNTRIDLTGQRIFMGATQVAVGGDPDAEGIFLGLHGGLYQFRIGNAGHLRFDGTNVTFSGALSSATGTVSAIAGTFGTITSGLLQGTNVTINLDATGSTPIISGTNVTITAAGAVTLGSHLSISTGGDVTFSGALSGATGTFSGSLSGVDGTFSTLEAVTTGPFVGAGVRVSGGEWFGGEIASIELWKQDTATPPFPITGSAISFPGHLLLASDTDIELAPTTYLVLTGLPTSNPGGSGRVWSDGGTLKIT